MKLDFVFVCQSGEFEIQAAILAASVRKFCPKYSGLYVIYPIPSEVYGHVSAPVTEFLSSLGAKVYHFVNPIADTYKIGNKLNAFNVEGQGDRIVFMDSDTVFLRPFEGYEKWFNRDFAAKAAEGQTFDSDLHPKKRWERVYDLFGLPYPAMKWRAQITGEWGPPYFNGGFLVSRPQVDFSRHWIETCVKIHNSANIDNKYPWLDQVGIPVTIERKKLSYNCLNERYNFPLHLKRLNDVPAFVAHYHWPKRIMAEPEVLEVVSGLIQEFHLGDVFPPSSAWVPIIEQRPQSHPKKTLDCRTPSNATSRPDREFFITGVPRSGTSLLCSLLDQQPNIAIINEPKEVFPVFSAQDFRPSFENTIKAWRERILRGEGVQCKMRDGQVSSNTYGTDTWGQYTTDVEDEDFPLGIKNTLVFLSRLYDIRRAYPEAVIISMIRHPYYTIGSWKRTFSHLREAHVAGPYLHGMNSPVISQDALRDLAQLHFMEDLAIKRAGFWVYLASIDLPDDPFYMRLRYEDLIEDPDACIKKIYSMLIPNGELENPGCKLTSRNDLSNYDMNEWDIECIQKICVNEMGQLGYEI